VELKVAMVDLVRGAEKLVGCRVGHDSRPVARHGRTIAGTGRREDRRPLAPRAALLARQALEEATGATKKTKRAVHHDLDRFFGTWTKEEADAFDERLREQRQIEPEMWK
jgi:hypothetical protein